MNMTALQLIVSLYQSFALASLINEKGLVSKKVLSILNKNKGTKYGVVSHNNITCFSCPQAWTFRTKLVGGAGGSTGSNRSVEKFLELISSHP